MTPRFLTFHTGSSDGVALFRAAGAGMRAKGHIGMGSLIVIYWLAGAGAIGLFVYLGYALLRPEKF